MTVTLNGNSFTLLDPKAGHRRRGETIKQNVNLKQALDGTLYCDYFNKLKLYTFSFNKVSSSDKALLDALVGGSVTLQIDGGPVKNVFIQGDINWDVSMYHGVERYSATITFVEGVA